MAWLYFIREGREGPIKIGHTTSLLQRMRTLQVGNPRNLLLCAAVFVEDDKVAEHERRVHGLYSDCRLIGEWFRPVPSLLDLVDRFRPKSCDRCQGVILGVEDEKARDVGPCFVCDMTERGEPIEHSWFLLP